MKINWVNNSNKTKFYRVDNKGYEIELNEIETCNRCNHLVKKEENCWIAKCNNCSTLISFFKPTPIQEVVVNCESNILFNIGAVGSGKTTISCYLLSTQLRLINNSRLICAAQTLEQLNRNAISELEKFFHISEFKKKTKDVWEFNNGAIVEFWPSDDEDKLRSANANFIWLIEANNFKMKLFFNQATSRIRNQLGMVYERDANGEIVFETKANGVKIPKVLQNRNLIIVEGNPKRGAWFNFSILNAHTIIYTKNVKGIDKIKRRSQPMSTVSEYSNESVNVDIVGVLNASYDNPLLDEKYFTNMRISCNSQEEYDQKIYCDITSESGLVYKNIVNNPNQFFKDIQSYDLTNGNLVFVEAFDPGGSKSNNDPDAYIFGVFDKFKKKLILLDGFKESGLNLVQTSQKIWEIRRKWFFKRERYLLFVADNALIKASKSNSNHSLKNDYELRLTTPITVCNDKSIGMGTGLVNNWVNNFSIEINKGPLEWLIKEIYGYESFLVAKPIKGSDAVKWETSYSETNNHGVDALRYLIVELERIGFRQDQAFIDYNQQLNQQSVSVGENILDKADVRRFLPQFNSNGIITPLSKFKIKF